MTVQGLGPQCNSGETASASPENAFGVLDAAFSLFDLDLRRQRRADWRLVGSVEMVRGRGRRRHRAACGGQGRGLTADRAGAVIPLSKARQMERTRAVGQERE